MLIFVFQILILILVVTELIAAALHYFDSASGAKAPPSSIQEYLKAGAGNALATLTSIVLIPWTYFARKQQAFDPHGGPPVVLVSGSLWGCGSAMFGLYKALKSRGARNVYLLPIAFSRGAIDRMADNLTEELERLNTRFGGEKPYLVAHGIAGLAARMGPSSSPGRYTRGTITIATPHNGTRLAIFIPGQLGFQLQPGSPLLKTLAHDPTDCILTFQSSLDSQIIPAESAGFGQRVRNLGHSGHLSILWSPELYEQILNEIRQLPPS